MKDWYKSAQHLDNVEKSDFNERELTRAIRDAIISENGAIMQYETIADSTDNDKVKKVLQNIANEELVHVGELMQLLADLIGDEEDALIEDGRREVKEDDAEEDAPEEDTSEEEDEDSE
jgi:rubrerythrin